jgi:hypothetical protein
MSTLSLNTLTRSSLGGDVSEFDDWSVSREKDNNNIAYLGIETRFTQPLTLRSQFS